MNYITLPYAILSYDDPIVNIVFKEDIELGFLEIKQLVLSAEELSAGKPYCTLSEVMKNVRITPIGRKLAVDKNEAPLNYGSAVVVNNVLLELAGNFFRSNASPEFSFRIFTDKEKAREWLLSLEPPKEFMN
jgi:hypothetical protein